MHDAATLASSLSQATHDDTPYAAQSCHAHVSALNQYVLACRSVAETVGRPDWKDLLTGKGNKDNRSGLGIYGTTKLFNIMLAREYARRLQARCQHAACAILSCCGMPKCLVVWLTLCDGLCGRG